MCVCVYIFLYHINKKILFQKLLCLLTCHNIGHILHDEFVVKGLCSQVRFSRQKIVILRFVLKLYIYISVHCSSSCIVVIYFVYKRILILCMLLQRYNLVSYFTIFMNGVLYFLCSTCILCGFHIVPWCMRLDLTAAFHVCLIKQHQLVWIVFKVLWRF